MHSLADTVCFDGGPSRSSQQLLPAVDGFALSVDGAALLTDR